MEISYPPGRLASGAGIQHQARGSDYPGCLVAINNFADPQDRRCRAQSPLHSRRDSGGKAGSGLTAERHCNSNEIEKAVALRLNTPRLLGCRHFGYLLRELIIPRPREAVESHGCGQRSIYKLCGPGAPTLSLTMRTSH